MAQIEFISYSGAYPTLCSGILLLRINGQLWAFNYESNIAWDPEGIKEVEDAREKEEVFICHNRFWDKGGGIYKTAGGEWTVHKGPWEYKEGSLPSELSDLASELIEVFNQHVEQGCCGGCL